MTYAESGLFWSQCFLPSLVIRKAQAGAGKSSLGLLCSEMAVSARVDSVLKIPEISGVESISSSAYWRDFVLWSCLGALAPQ